MLHQRRLAGAALIPLLALFAAACGGSKTPTSKGTFVVVEHDVLATGTTTDSVTRLEVRATCADGETLVGGGYLLDEDPSVLAQVGVEQSYPLRDPATGTDTWQVRAVLPITSGPATVTVHALAECMTVTDPSTPLHTDIRSGSHTYSRAESGTVELSATCPSGTLATGGGFTTSHAAPPSTAYPYVIAATSMPETISAPAWTVTFTRGRPEVLRAPVRPAGSLRAPVRPTGSRPQAHAGPVAARPVLAHFSAGPDADPPTAATFAVCLHVDVLGIRAGAPVSVAVTSTLSAPTCATTSNPEGGFGAGRYLCSVTTTAGGSARCPAGQITPSGGYGRIWSSNPGTAGPLATIGATQWPSVNEAVDRGWRNQVRVTASYLSSTAAGTPPPDLVLTTEVWTACIVLPG